jgi:hypothetical protein
MKLLQVDKTAEIIQVKELPTLFPQLKKMFLIDEEDYQYGSDFNGTAR